MKRFNYLPLYVIGFSFWSILLLMRINGIISDEKISHISAQIVLFLHVFMVIAAFTIFRNAERDKKILFWLILSNIGLFLNDFSFYSITYFSENYNFNFSLISYVINMTLLSIWNISILIFLIKLVKVVLTSKKLIKLFSMLMLINFAIIFLFFDSARPVFNYLSWQNISQIINSLIELIIYDLSILCLIYSGKKGLSFIVVGLIFLISGDFILSYSFLSQTNSIATYGELFWFLGILCFFFGMLDLKYQKNCTNWLRSTNSIKGNLAFWAFGISLVNILPFFGLAYLFSPLNKTVFLVLPPFLMITSVFVVIISLFTAKFFEIPFKKIANNIESLMINNDKSKINNHFVIEEFIFLQEFILNVFDLKEEKEAAKKALISLTAQVAHDMRSPLLAVDSFFRLVENKLEESERVFGRRAIRRLDDIAWSLLSKYKNKSDHDAENSYVFLHSCIQEILSEKRMEYTKQNIEFELIVSPNDAFSLVYLSSVNLKRMLSNIINNSVNAILPNSGIVEVCLEVNIAGALISIKDNGRGMSQDFIQGIFSKSEKIKTNLGIPHAMKFVEEEGGILDINSIEGNGTTVNISLPPCETPFWLIKEYQIQKDEILIIIDDSKSVHDVWEGMLREFHGVECEHFYHANEALIFLKNIENKKLIIFCDYEFLNEDINGLYILESAPSDAIKTLVTSHFYDPKIMKETILKGFKILPKDLVPYFQLRCANYDLFEKQIHLIFIDNEPRNTQSWEYFAEIKNLKIVTYNDIRKFFMHAQQFEKNIPIYIDLNLSDEKNGIDYAKEIYNLGFKQIYIATGAIDFDIEKSNYPWITEVIEKRFPFI